MAIGTRSSSRISNALPSTRSITASYSQDKSMSKLATGAMTFDAATGRVTLAGALNAFSLNDRVMVEGTAKNNGFFLVTGLGGGDYLVLKPAPATEATAAATLRTE